MKIHTPTLEKKINTHLASLPFERKPESSSRERIVSVAISARDAFEASTHNGHAEFVTRDTAAGWLNL